MPQREPGKEWAPSGKVVGRGPSREVTVDLRLESSEFLDM